MSGFITWEFNDKFDQRACDYLARRYEAQGEKEAGACIRLRMSVDHDSHVALVAITEFLKLPEAT